MTKLKGRNIIFILITMALLIPEALVAKTNISKSPLRESWAPRIAIDFAGNLHVAWLELSTSTSGDIFYSRYDAITKTWSDPINLSNSGNIFSHSLWAHDIAADSSNRVYVVWVEKNSAKLRIWDGVWGPEILVNSGGWYYDSPRLEVSPEGDIFIIWWTEDGMIWSKARVGGEWEATRLLSPSTARSKFPDISVGRNIVAACWMERGAGEDWYQIVYSQRDRTKNAAWTKSMIIAPAGADQQHGAIKLDYLDRAHIVCTPEIVTATRQVYYMWGTISGFSRAEPISGIENIHYPFLAEEGGNIYVCWQAGSYGDGIGVFYNIRREGKWEGEKVFPDTLGATYCDVVVAQDGSALYVTWDAGREIFVSSLTLPITNRPPVADFTFSPQRGEIPLTVTFDASPSYDPDGTIVSYHWTFGDGGSGTGKIVNYTYRSEGKFSVTLTVTDDKGKKATATKVVETVHVVYPPNNPTVSITISGLRKEPSANYRLSWAANPKNADELVKEYRIYRKEGDGEFKLFSIVGKTTTSVEYSFPPTKRLMWGITTFSTLNKESSMIIFK